MGEVFKRLLDSLSPQQICWTCLLVTLGMAVYGVKTFADNGSVRQLAAVVTDMRVTQIAERAFDLRVKVCSAIKEGKSPFVFTQQLQPLIDSYKKMTHDELPLPECWEL